MKNRVTPFVDTKNTDKVIRLAKTTVDNRGWLVIIGEVGAGKSYLVKQLSDFWKANPNKFTLVDMGKVFERGSFSVSGVMKSMLKQIAPDEEMPGNIQGKYDLIRKALSNNVSMNRKIILLFDEAQNLSASTIRDLKKLHEIESGEHEHLFAILMFGKNSSRWENLLNGQEVGWRVSKNYLYNLEKEEILKFAKDSHNITFEAGRNGDRAKQLFLSNTHPTPLGVKRMVNIIEANDDSFTGKVTEESLRTALGTSLKQILTSSKISYRTIQDRLLKNRNLKVDKSTVSKVMSYQTEDVKSETAQAIIDEALAEINVVSGGNVDLKYNIAANG